MLLLAFTESLLCFREYINTASCSHYKKTNSEKWSHSASRWQSWCLNPGLSNTKILKHDSSGVMVPLQRVRHIPSVHGLNLKIRQYMPSYFLSILVWTESAEVRHPSLSQLIWHRIWEWSFSHCSGSLPLWLMTAVCGLIACTKLSWILIQVAWCVHSPKPCA